MSQALPELVRKYRTVSPTELKQAILRDYNKDISDSAVRMFIVRNPEVFKPLEKEMIGEDSKQIEVNEAIFQNGTFNSLNSIKKWNIEKTGLVSGEYQKGNVDAIKRICKGVFYLKDPATKKLTECHVPNWTLKHPDRLTLEQAQEFVATVHKAKSGTKQYRIAVRDFFLSREHITLKTTEMSGLMPKIGKWKHVYVERADIDKILAYVKERNYTAFVADLTMFKLATRSTATLTEFLHKKLRLEEGYHLIEVTDKGFHRTGRQTFDKVIPDDLLKELENCWNMHGENAFDGLDEQVLRDLNKEAYRQFLTGESLELGLAEPNHFWRHQFGQHMLRATNWNYSVVAYLGSWKDEKMLKEVYGAPTSALLREWGMQYVPKI